MFIFKLHVPETWVLAYPFLTPASSWLSLNLQEILAFLGDVSVAGDKTGETTWGHALPNLVNVVVPVMVTYMSMTLLA